MADEVTKPSVYPETLFCYSNEADVAVKRMGKTASGWKSDLVETSLIRRLNALAERIKSGNQKEPVAVYFVGGPGNGKTAVAEHFLKKLYGTTPDYPDCADNVQAFGEIPGVDPSCIDNVVLVEDATAGVSNESAEETLIRGVSKYVFRRKGEKAIYVCCINRGILVTSARKYAERFPEEVSFLESLSRAVAASAGSQSVWPIGSNPEFGEHDGWANNVYVWPMDLESIFDPSLYEGSIEKTPAYQVLSRIVDGIDLSHCASCKLETRELCPFYSNAISMKHTEKRQQLIKMLHAFEIASGNRIQFRNLFAVINVLFVGTASDYKSEIPINGRLRVIPPCQWVEQKVANIRDSRPHFDRRGRAYLELLSRYYVYVLFSDWEEFQGVDRSKSLSDKNLTEVAPAIKEMFRWLSRRRRDKVSTSGQDIIRQQFSKLMDVAFVEERRELESVEEAFSSTLELGVERVEEFTDSFRKLTLLERDFLKYLLGLNATIEANEVLVADASEVNVTRVQQLLRIFACRFSKRALGALNSAVAEGNAIADYFTLITWGPGAKDISRELRNTFQSTFLPDKSFDASIMQGLGRVQNNVPESLHLTKAGVFPVIPAPKPEEQHRRHTGQWTDIHCRELKISDYNVCINITFDMFLALRKIRYGLDVSALPEHVSIKLNSIASQILGCLVHQHEGRELEFKFYNPLSPGHGTLFEYSDNEFYNNEEF